jgi:hypothetical protein
LFSCSECFLSVLPNIKTRVFFIKRREMWTINCVASSAEGRVTTKLEYSRTF